MALSDVKPRAMGASGQLPRESFFSRMIDNFSIGLTHGLMMLAAILLMFRRDLDKDPPVDRRTVDRGDGSARPDGDA
jgi:threonine aldolase